MKILAFVDIHGNFERLESIIARAKGVDMLVCAGDISNFEQNLDKLLGRLDNANKPVLIVHGNHESDLTLKKACSGFKNIIFLHKGMFELGDHIFLGYGGGGFSRIDDAFARFAKHFEPKLTDKKKVVLITHAPVHGTELDFLGKEHRGNKSIRDFVDRVDLTLVICGHFHEHAGKKDRIKKTLIVNPGPKGMVLEV